MNRKNIYLFIAVIFILGPVHIAWPIEKGPILTSIKKITNSQVMGWARNPIVVNAVKDANKFAARPSEEITQLDNKWKSETDSEWMNGFLNNTCADYLKDVQGKEESNITLFPEIFVMDRQGCIVAETNRTSDYWQGDEDKFIKSFAGGKGEIFIDEPSFDASSRTYTVQVSVPVMDPDTNQAIGAITAGIDLDAIGEKALE